jgi:magnesium-transporting ATPase (P-type)
LRQFSQTKTAAFFPLLKYFVQNLENRIISSHSFFKNLLYFFGILLLCIFPIFTFNFVLAKNKIFMIKAMSRALSIVPYELIDIGANLGHPGYKNDLEQVLERAQKAGIFEIFFFGCKK